MGVKVGGMELNEEKDIYVVLKCLSTKILINYKRKKGNFIVEKSTILMDWSELKQQ